MLSQTAYDQAKLDCLEATMSPERLKAYIAKSKGDRAAAFRLYLWNTSLSASLYGPLQALEVSLRNALNRELCAKYGLNWYKNTKPVLFLDNQADRLIEAMKGFDKSRPITVSDVVASVSFGFWTDILHFEMYDELWKQCLHKAFPNKPKGTKRNTIAPIIKQLKYLRNRVAHHDPIWNRNLIKEHNAIIEIINWICPITGDWVNQHSSFPSVWKDSLSLDDH